jgi:hypothetical protein|tara:strand:- start:117 stop:494 length:378 start_codon:yes stop_codon:yes gene_type:complete
MDLFHKIIDLIDKNSDRIPEGDYLELCDTIQELRRQVKPPSFLLDQNRPLWMSGEAPVYEPTLPVTDGQPRDWMDNEEEELTYPGLNQFLQELHAEWSDPVEPGAYYPPPRDGTTVVEVTVMDVD